MKFTLILFLVFSFPFLSKGLENDLIGNRTTDVKIDTLIKDAIVIEKHSNLCIVKQLGKTGLIDNTGKTILPLTYDDVYFINEQYFWVKIDTSWAVVDVNNKFLSDFLFYDIDKLNAHNYNNFMYFVDVDTVNIPSDSSVNMDYKQTYFINETYKSYLKFKSEKNRRIISEYCVNSAKMLDGYHIIDIKNDRVTVDSFAWDNLFLISKTMSVGCDIGVVKNGKYGYYNSINFKFEDIKYEGIYFNPKLYSYKIYAYSSSPFAIIKKNTIFYHYSYYYKPWWQNIPLSFLSSSETKSKSKWKRFKNKN